MRWIRVKLEDRLHPDLAVHIDLIVDEQFRIAADLPYSGWIGKIRSNQCFPFLYRSRKDGIWGFDFGQNPQDEKIGFDDRINIFRLNEKSLREGEKIVFLNEQQDEDFPERMDLFVRSVVDLTNPKESIQ